MKIEEYCKKKGLSFESLDSEFDISDIEKGNFAFKIAEKIVRKIEKFRGFVEEFLHADGSSFAVLMEIKGMDEEDKDKMNSLYKDMILIERNLLLVELENKEEALLGFIKGSLDKWNKIKPDLIGLIETAKGSWNDISKAKENLGYLG